MPLVVRAYAVVRVVSGLPIRCHGLCRRRYPAAVQAGIAAQRGKQCIFNQVGVVGKVASYVHSHGYTISQDRVLNLKCPCCGCC